ncbi:hypothetical protein CTI12_AA553210 [Artemisia annua]|uniref:Uncharacterized protein n=1 Tax=Artemisia annua TaxID=35608 RepID=A0A2U1KXS4_ARTAN|nr:hypothetical protein CTI12_AA553210 [Artemisia annua]
MLGGWNLSTAWYNKAPGSSVIGKLMNLSKPISFKHFFLISVKPTMASDIAFGANLVKQLGYVTFLAFKSKPNPTPLCMPNVSTSKPNTSSAAKAQPTPSAKPKASSED